MKSWGGVLAGLLAGLLLSGVIILIIIPHRGKPVVLLSPPTPSPLVVHIDGEVNNPGVYQLAANSRLADAIDAAGGAQADADLSLVNLAHVLVDGDRVWVPQKVDQTQEAVLAQTEAALRSSPTPIPLSAENPININTASESELDLLPGIGPVKAAAIYAYRQQYGPFTSIEAIKNVPGISASVYEGIKDLISIYLQP